MLKLQSAIAQFILMFGLISSVASQASLPEFAELVERASPAVVKINTQGHVQQNQPLNELYEQFRGHPQIPDIFRHLFEPHIGRDKPVRSMGSGFIISADGYILTNHHVIESASEIQVRLIDRREFVAEVVGVDERSDLALLKVTSDKALPYLRFAPADKVRVGEWVLAIGSPFGLDYSVSAGIVSAIGRSIPGNGSNYVPFIQTDVAINPGNSGGPLFNLDGEVVGINSQIYTRSGGSIGLSFAIPSGLAQQVVQQLKSKGRVDRGWLGVVIQEVDRDLAESFGLKKPSGALVAQLESDGPAEKAGLKVGDVILRLGETDILRSSDLPHAVGAAMPGAKVKLGVMRAGKMKSITVTVGSLDGQQQLSEYSGQSESNQQSAAGRLGVVVEPLTESVRKDWQVAGVLVRQVIQGGPVAKAGLQVGDVIAQIGFQQVDSMKSFEAAVDELPSGQLLPIRFFRQGKPAFRTIVLDP